LASDCCGGFSMFVLVNQLETTRALLNLLGLG